MIKFLLKIAVVLVIALVSYNYFLGTPEEKKQSQEIIGKASELGKSGWNVLKSEKEKFDNGKYDDAIDRVGELVQND